LGLLLQGLLLGGVCEETGDEAIGHLLKGLVNQRFQLRESGGVTSELVGPALLLGEELFVDVLKGRWRGRDIRAGVRIEANLHGLSLRGEDGDLR
jgi:hypothetical protein